MSGNTKVCAHAYETFATWVQQGLNNFHYRFRTCADDFGHGNFSNWPRIEKRVTMLFALAMMGVPGREGRNATRSGYFCVYLLDGKLHHAEERDWGRNPYRWQGVESSEEQLRAILKEARESRAHVLYWWDKTFERFLDEYFTKAETKVEEAAAA